MHKITLIICSFIYLNGQINEDFYSVSTDEYNCKQFKKITKNEALQLSKEVKVDTQKVFSKTIYWK